MVGLGDVEGTHGVVDGDFQGSGCFVYDADEFVLEGHAGGVEFSVHVRVERFVGVHQVGERSVGGEGVVGVSGVVGEVGEVGVGG